jgi:hypothetical protein
MTEVVILVAYSISMLLIVSNFEVVLTVLFIIALLFPVAFYHHSWSAWLSFDHLVETLPRDTEEGSGRTESDFKKNPQAE